MAFHLIHVHLLNPHVTEAKVIVGKWELMLIKREIGEAQ